ncbi:MAG: DUF485 domain-containing protein [Gammaproteobacteria bacterium]|jgi:uncharacterized membrane protein (DUF485 family)
MQDDLVQRIKNHPKYHELVTKRQRFGWTLALLMLGVYYGFILLVAYAKGFLGTPVSEGSVMTIGIPIGIGVILFAFALTGIYVWRANTEFDRLNREIKETVL